MSEGAGASKKRSTQSYFRGLGNAYIITSTNQDFQKTCDMEIEQAYKRLYVINRRTKMLQMFRWRTVPIEEPYNTKTKHTKPQGLRNGNDSTVEDFLFSNEPTRISVDNFKGYSPEQSDSVNLINDVRLGAWMSAHVFTYRRKVGDNGRWGSNRWLYLEIFITSWFLLQLHRPILRFGKAMPMLLDVYPLRLVEDVEGYSWM